MKKIAALSVLLTLLVVTAVAADILVGQDGKLIETRGPWRVKGRTVIFTSKAGVLSSLRLDEINMEASEAATEKEKNPEPPPPPPPLGPTLGAAAATAKPPTGEAVLTLTNKDLGSSRPAVSASAIGLDLSSHDEGVRRRALDYYYEVSKQLVVVHKTYDLKDPAGVKQASGALGQIARQTRVRASIAEPQYKAAFEQIASEMETIAARALTSPEAVVKIFHKIPDAEELGEEEMRVLDSDEGREAFEEEIVKKGGG
jgi:hypothetical protein